MADAGTPKFPKSPIAQEIERLKVATESAAAKREHLPQPLFWSLFGSQIKELRAAKKRDRELREIFEAKD